MSKFIQILVAVLFTTNIYAQTPEKISYQSVVRNNLNQLIVNQTLVIQISILRGSINGVTVYIEFQTPTTNANGLVTMEIGTRTVLLGDFSEIDWSNGPYFIKTDTDPTGGMNFTITGISELLSVPYALYAKTTDSTLFATNSNMNALLNNKVDKATGQSLQKKGTYNGQIQCWMDTTWVNLQPGCSGDILHFINGMPMWGPPGMVIVDVYNPITGRTWMDRNLGASQVATSSSDAASYGDLYQWGRGRDGHQKRNSGYTINTTSSDYPGHGNFIIIITSPYDWHVPQNNNLWQGVNGINNPCPNGYRIPTEAEWTAERATWSSNTVAGAFGSILKLPAGGNRSGYSADIYGEGTNSGYWTSTVSGTEARYIGVGSSGGNIYNNQRAEAYSIRCIKN